MNSTKNETFFKEIFKQSVRRFSHRGQQGKTQNTIRKLGVVMFNGAYQTGNTGA